MDTTSKFLHNIQEVFFQDLTESEFHFFWSYCQKIGLDPLSKQIFVLKRCGKLAIQVSIDGLRLIAERSGKYQGQLGPFWCANDGIWKDVWLAKEPPAAAKVGILCSNFKEPIWGIARMEAYKQTSSIWTKMPDLMLAKCAEAQALRKAFPSDMSRLYRKELYFEGIEQELYFEGIEQELDNEGIEQELDNEEIEKELDDEILPLSLRGKKITLKKLATDENLIWKSQKNGRIYNGRQLLYMWKSWKEKPELQRLAWEALEKFPSSKEEKKETVIAPEKKEE